jgi:hypothetical protein
MAPLAALAATKIGATTVGAIATKAAVVGGTALSAIGTIQAGRAESGAASAEAELAEAQASQEGLREAEQERLIRKSAKELQGRQRAAAAASGVRVGTGTPLLIQADTLLTAEEDIATLKANTDVAKSRFRSSAQTFKEIGKSRRTASRFKAGSSVLSGLSQL